MNHVLNAWARQNSGAAYAEQLIKKVIDQRMAGNENAIATTDMYNALISSWVPSWGDGKMTTETALACAERAEAILRYMQSEYEAGGEIRPNIKSFNTVVKAWYNSASPIAPTRAGRILKWVYDIHKKGTNGPDFRPSFYSFSRVIELYSFRNCATDADSTLLCAERAEEILEFMEELAYTGNDVNPTYRYLRPSVSLYNAVIAAYAKCNSMSSSSVNVAKKAERLLHRMIYLRKHFHQTDLHPTVLSYNSVINAWSKSGCKTSAAKRVETILNYLEDSCNLVNPDKYSYTTTIDAWAKSGDPLAAEKAQNILMRMENNIDVTPNTISYNAVLNSWSKSPLRDAPRKAEGLLRKMQYFYNTGINSEAEPDMISYNTVIMAWAKYRQEDAAACGQSAEHLLNECEQLYEMGHAKYAPTVFTYNTVVEAWTKSNNPNAKRGEMILERMLQASTDRKDLIPDAYGFNSVIQAYSKLGTPASAAKAEELLMRMTKLYEEGNEKIRPQLYTYTTVMDAVGKCGTLTAASKVEGYFRDVVRRYEAGQLDLKPDTVCFNSLLAAYRNAGGKEGAEAAEVWLERMEEEYSIVEPNVYSYNHVLVAWANSGAENIAARRAEAILKRMTAKGVKIDAFSYNSVINAWSKSSRPKKAQKALSIVRGMDALYRRGNKDIRPNAYSYTTVINACAFSNAETATMRSRLLGIAVAALQELQSSPRYGPANHITYGTFLKACANLIDEDDEMLRKVMIEPVFIKCCQDGQVGEFVLRQLRVAAPDDLYEKLLGEYAATSNLSNSVKCAVNIEDVPKEWRRNVKEKTRNKKWKNRGVAPRSPLPKRSRS
mmetsp:Transcript_9514/g.14149  ORF Transcript_9514/g.14149 Transcript_9514/m.14149 type:complete len:833 (+) Transcript_9514:2-2500(+)